MLTQIIKEMKQRKCLLKKKSLQNKCKKRNRILEIIKLIRFV